MTGKRLQDWFWIASLVILVAVLAAAIADAAPVNHELPVPVAQFDAWDSVVVPSVGPDLAGLLAKPEGCKPGPGLGWGHCKPKDDDTPTTATPEPGTLAMLGAGLIVLSVMSRRWVR